MSPALRLGLRLAGVGARSGWDAARTRSLMVVLTSAVGSFLLLVVGAIIRSEVVQRPYGLEGGVRMLLLAVVIVVGLPVLTLAATSGRLSAAMRDRRLANLRLLGLSPAQTRMVAAVETGAMASAGAVIGSAGFILTRPLVARLHPAGRDWPVETLWPEWRAAVLAVIAVPVAVIAVSVLPQRSGARTALAQSRRGQPRRPRRARLIPLVLGFGLSAFVIVRAENQYAQEAGSNEWLAPYMFAGIVLLGLGTLLAVPVMVRLLADALVSRSNRPGLLIAGRRLQAQPAATTRLIAGLLIGLFIVTGARAIVVAFEDTPQYRSSVLAKTTGQVATVYTGADDAAQLQQRLDADPNVRQTAAFPRLATSCDGPDDYCGSAVIATCAELRAFYSNIEGCLEGEPLWIGGHAGEYLPEGTTTISWQAVREGSPSGGAVRIPAPQNNIHTAGSDVDLAEVLLPPTTSGISKIASITEVAIDVRAKPGVQVENVINGLGPIGATVPDSSYYSFVDGLRYLVWAIAVLVLTVGLLAFGVASIDRAAGRRAELVSLQLIGVRPGLLRWTQWVEIAVPLALGATAAIGCGLLAGTTFLSYGSIVDQTPWRPTLILAGVAALSSLLVAASTLVAASPRIEPETIRTE